MLSRLMDLVVMVAELNRESDRSFTDLDKELEERGFSSDEIEQAVFWLSSRSDGEEAFPVPGNRAVRVLSEWERVSINAESYGYLLRLLNLGIIDWEQFEKIIARAIPVGTEKIQLNDVKEIACSVVFNRDLGDLDDDAFEQFEEDAPSI